MADLGVRYVMVRTDRGEGGGGRQRRARARRRRRGRGTSTRSPRREIVEAADRAARRRRASAAATSVSATSRSARAGSNTPRSGRRCRPTTVRPTGSASRSRSTWTPRVGEPGDRGRKVDIVVPAEPIDAGRPARRSRCPTSTIERAVVSLLRRPDRRAGAGPGQLLPELGGDRAPTARTASAPNMMVVVPTANDVEMTYGRSALDWLLLRCSRSVGIALCFYWRCARRRASIPTTRDRSADDAADADRRRDRRDRPDRRSRADRRPARIGPTTPIDGPAGVADRHGSPHVDRPRSSEPSVAGERPADSVDGRHVRPAPTSSRRTTSEAPCPTSSNVEVAHALGVGFAQFVEVGRRDRVVVARDMRPSGPKLRRRVRRTG